MSKELHAWLDVTAGVAGDMLLGATLDAGAPLAKIQDALELLVPGAVRIEAETVVRGGQRGTKALVRVLVDDPPHRTWASIRDMLGQHLGEEGRLHPRTVGLALGAFGALAEAEARVHGTPVDDVHFHEVGALDSIADIVGACEGLRLLGVESVSASPLALGAGRIRAAHGDIPVPVPAVLELVRGWPVQQTSYSGATRPLDKLGERTTPPEPSPSAESVEARALAVPSPVAEPVEAHHHEPVEAHGHHHHHHHHHDEPAAVTTPGEVGELATPTGVALVTSLSERCETMPTMQVQAVGIGAGGKDFVDHPNVVRLVVGELPQAAHVEDPEGAEVLELMANVDDMDPRLWPGVLEALLQAGARDAWLVPIVMKKGRPAHTVHALVRAADEHAVGQVLLRQTSTLGYRVASLRRTMLQRAWREVEVLGQQVQVKVGHRDGHIVHATAEFESLAAAAAALGIPQFELSPRVGAAMAQSGLVAGRDLDA